MTPLALIWTSCFTMKSAYVALLLAILPRQIWTYNCSRSLSPWIYVNESDCKEGNPVLYDGKPIEDIIGVSFKRSPLFGGLIKLNANGSVLFDVAIKVDATASWIIPTRSILFDYHLICKNGKNSSISIIVLDENDKPPEPGTPSNFSISLSTDTCVGQEVYNFAYTVHDTDFADKPNEEKLQLRIIEQIPIPNGIDSFNDYDPVRNPFIISGRLSLVLMKPLDRRVSAYNMSLAVQDTSFRRTIFSVRIDVAQGMSRNSNSSNLQDNCTTLSDLQRGTPAYDCSYRFGICLLESKAYGGHRPSVKRDVRQGRRITEKGHAVENVLKLTKRNCNGLKNTSLGILNLTHDGIVVIRDDFNVDDMNNEGYLDIISCEYDILCKGKKIENTLTIMVVDENDEKPIFKAYTPRLLPMSQNEELVYSFQGYVHDRDYMDWPNDERLELVIVSPMSDSCGNVLPGVISVTERLSLKIYRMGNVTRCSPYQVTMALKDQAMNIGPHHTMTFYDSTGGDDYCNLRTLKIGETRIVTLPKTKAPSVITPLCLTTDEPLLVAQCRRIDENISIAEYNITLSTASCSDDIMRSQLADLYLVPLTEENLLNVTMELRDLTSTPAELQPSDLNHVSRILENVYRLYENSTNATVLLSNVSSNVAKTVSNIMDANYDFLEKSRKRDTLFTARVVGSLDSMLLKLAEAVTKAENDNTSHVELAFEAQNLAYKVATGEDISGISTCSYVNATKTVNNLFYNSLKTECLLFNGFPKAELRLSPSTRDVPRVFVVYHSAKLFGTGAISGAAVLSAQLTTKLVQQESPTETHLVSLRQHIDKKEEIGSGNRLACGYWNFSTNRWETDGCSGEPKKDGQGLFVCTCDHLTNFAVLLVPCAGNCGDSVHDEVLSYLSVIFLGISCTALVFVIVTFLAYRELRRSDGQRLTACLSASLLCMNLLFIFGMNAASESKAAAATCSALAAALHYFLLTTFLFMTAEVIMSYLLLVKVFGAHVSHFIWKVLAVCLGVPAVLVLSIRFADPALYVRGDQFCWVQLTLQIYGVMLPIGLMIAFNLIVFILIARTLSRRPQIRCSISERAMAIRQAKALVAIFVVLGITWSFGLLAAIQASSVVFQYLFVICNALQGLFVFVFHNVKAPAILRCLRNAVIRDSKLSVGKCSNGAQKDVSLTNLTTGGANGIHRSNIGEKDLSAPPNVMNDHVEHRLS